MTAHPAFRSVRTALFVVLLAALLPSFVIIVLSGYERIAQIKSLSEEGLLRQLEAVAEIQNRLTLITRQTLSTVAKFPMIKNLDPGASEAVLKAVLDANPGFLNFTLTDDRGVVVASALLRRGENLSVRRSIQDALRFKGFAAGEYIVSRAGGEASFNFSHAVLDDSLKAVGTVSGVYRLEMYTRIIDNLRLPANSMFGITDYGGIRLFHHPPSPATNPVGGPINPKMWECINAGRDEASLILAGSDGVERLYVWKKLRLSLFEPPYMHLVLGIPAKVVMTEARSMLFRNVLLGGGIFVLSLVIVKLFSDLVFGRSFRALVDATERLHSGDYSARTGLASDGSDLGRVAGALDRMAAALELREAERAEEEAERSRSLAEKEMLLREIHHRVKNNLQIILSLVSLQEHSNEPTSVLAKKIEARINAMSLVHEILYRSEDLGSVDCADYVRRLCGLLVESVGGPQAVRVEVRADSFRISMERAVSFAHALNELLLNAVKHASRGGEPGNLRVSLSRKEEDAVLTVEDDGEGLPAGFHPESSAGLGMHIVLGLAAQLGGSLGWENRKGAAFILRFPVRPLDKINR